MADFEISLQAKLDEKSLESINAEIKSLQDKLNKIDIKAEIDPKVISGIENRIKALEKMATKIQIDADTSKATAALNNIGKDANKIGQNAGRQAGQGFSSSLQSSLNAVKRDIASALDTFDSKKLKSQDLRNQFGLNLPNVDSSVTDNIRKATNELRKFEKEIFNADSAEATTSAWGKVADKIREIQDIISANGKSRIDNGIYQSSKEIADYFSGKTIFTGSKSDVLASTGMTIQELRQQFKGLNVSFKETEKGATQLDSVWEELFKFDPSLQGIDNYSDQLAKIVEHLKVAQSLKGQKGFQELDVSELNNCLNDYMDALENTSRKIQVYRSEQTELEQQIAQQSTSAADTIAQNEQRKQQAYQKTADTIKKIPENQSIIKSGSNVTTFENSNNAAREAAEYFSTLLENENAVISVSERFGDLNGLTSFSVNIKRATGEVETLRYGLEELIDVAGNKTGEFVFSSKGAELNNAGAIKQLQTIENQFTNYTKEIARFKSTNSEILSGLTDPLSDFESKLSVLKSGGSTIDEVKNAFNRLNAEASNITKNFSRQLNPIDVAIRKLNNGEAIISGLTAEFKGLNNAPKEVNSELKKCSELLNNVKNIENKQGRTEEWAKSYREWSNAVDQLQSKLNTLKKEQANNASTQVFTKDELISKEIPYMSKVYNTIEKQMDSIYNMANKKGWDIVDVSGVERADGLIKQLTLTVQNAEGAVKKFNMQRIKVQGGGDSKKVQDWLVQTGDVRTLKSSAEASEELTNRLIKSYQQIQDLEVKKAGLDTSKDVQQIAELERQIDNFKVKYDEAYAEAQSKKFFDASGFEQQKVAIDAETTARINSVTSINQVKAAYEELLSLASQAGKTEIDLFKLDPNKNAAEIDELTAKLEQLKARYDEVYGSLLASGNDLSPAQFETLGKVLENTEQKLSELRAQFKDKIDVGIDTGKFEGQLTSVENKMRQFSVESDDLKGKTAELREAFDIMSSPDRSIDEKIAAYRQFSAVLPSVESELRQLGESYRLTAAEQNTLTRSQTLSNNIQTWMNENRKAAEKYGETLKQLQTQLNGNTDQQIYRQANASFANIKSQSRMFGLVDNSMVKSLKNTALYMTGFGSMFQAVNTVFRNIKEATTFARELDSALTNINYTMDVTASQLETVGSKSIEMAKNLHTSTENVLQAVTLYANAKETTDTILEKAQPAIMLSNVTGFSGEESAKYLQTIMNQFDLTQDDLMDISDTIQAVSQNIAHDFSDGIVQINEGISTSGEVARAAGMTLSEYASMIGLLVERTGLAGSQIGNSIKTIITRTTKASKILGIDEGEISDAEESLKSIGIAVRKSDGEFREFNDTMADLSAVWDTLSDVEKSNVAFNLAGTRQINIIQTLLRNWSSYGELIDKANNSSGVTFENQEKYVESLDGKMSELSTTMQSAWHNIINEKDVTPVIDVLQNFANVIDSLTEKLGLFGTIGVGAGIVALIKNFGNSNEFALYGCESIVA